MSVCPVCRGQKTVSEVSIDPDTAGAVIVKTCPRCNGSGGWLPPPRPPAASKPDAKPKTPPLAENKLLQSKLFEQCPGCRGTGKTASAMMVDGLKRPGSTCPRCQGLGKCEGEGCVACNGRGSGEPRKYSGPLAIGADCPLCDKTGYIEIGMTVLQLERLKARYDLLLQFCVDVHDESKGGSECAVSAPFLKDFAADVLSKMTDTDVTAARAEVARKRRAAKQWNDN